MRTISCICSLLLLVFATPLAALTPPHFWSHRFGSTSDDVCRDVAMDVSGNVVIAGSFNGTVDFGGGPLASAGGTDIFLAKYSATGAHLWSKRFGGTGADVGVSVAIDGAGNVFVIGDFSATVDFGGGALVSAGGLDIFLAKYDANGTHQWSQRYGTTNDGGLSVDVDGAGNVLATGFYSGTVDFGGGGLAAAGGSDIFVVKFTTAGAPLWSKRFGGGFDDRGWALATDAANSVVVTGIFSDSVDFGGGPFTAVGLDIFVAKYNSSGTHQWSQAFGGTSSERSQDIATDFTGAVLVTGYFQDSVDFGGGALTSVGSADIFLAKYDAFGAHQWSKRFGTLSSDVGYAVEADWNGLVYLTGMFQGAGVDFGGGPFDNVGSADVFLAKFDPNGVHQWSYGIGGPNGDIGNSVATRGSDEVVVAGEFRLTLDFGGGPLTSAGGIDAFVAKMGTSASTEPVITSILDIPNDQGRAVRVAFTRSGHDANASPTSVTQYDVYRFFDVPFAGFDFVGSVPAHRDEKYSLVCPTLGDSTIAQGQFLTSFWVRAATADAGVVFNSDYAAGYSVDNLAPSAPGDFAIAAGVLSWDESEDADFDYFSVYGSASSVLDGSAVLIDQLIATSLDVSASPHSYYYVTATDFSGNEGKASRVNTLSNIGETPKAYSLGVNSYPNPFNPATTVRYDVPSAGRAVVAIYDAKGALVTTLVDGPRQAGSYPVRWDGTDGRGVRVSSGVYFVRLQFGDQTRARKVVLLK